MVSSASDKPLVLTMGDPAGIGPDITLQSWDLRNRFELPAFFVIADPDILKQRQKSLGLDFPIADISSSAETLQYFDKALPVLPISLETTIEAGHGNPKAAPSILSSIAQAVALTVEGQASAIITNPINKHVLYETGFSFPGHTEFLSALAKQHFDIPPTKMLFPRDAVMMLVAEDLRVVPVTIHIPLQKVPEKLSRQLIIDTAKTVASDLKTFFGIAHPRLAVTGLNPHAGENGALGSEEQDIISPALAQLQQEGYLVSGPHPADTIFHAGARKTYDAVLAMYHDQALIPVKTIGFDRGVNITLGLPFIRTSPDHGTAYNIAGSGLSNPRSLIEAIKMADRMAHNFQTAAYYKEHMS